jgi:hypothetical protein
MRTHAGYDEMEEGPAQLFDAVVHFAAVPRYGMVPDTETWRVNVVGTYNVIEAALKMGIRKVIIASSETTYGVCFSDGVVDPKVLPLEEDYDIDPMDTYGTSKKVNEVTARSLQRRFGADVYALRIGNVIEPHEYATVFPALKDGPRPAAADHLQLHRRARPGADRGPVPEEGWPWASRSSTRSMTRTRCRSRTRSFCRVFPERAAVAAGGGTGGASVQPEDQGGAGVQGAASWQKYVK